MGEQHTSVALGSAAQGLPVAECTGFVIDHRVVAENVAIDHESLVYVRHTNHHTNHTSGQPVFIDEDIVVLHHLKKISARVIEIECGQTARIGKNL